MRSVRHAIRVHFFLFILLALSTALRAQESADELTPAAKEAVEKGVNAAGQKEWKLAIRYFEEARKAAPHSPVTLYNLALAEMQFPGRELRAVACFEAYFLAAPQTDKAVAIRGKIANLELKTEANTGLIIDMLKELAGKYTAASYELHGAQQSIAVLQAHAGDVNAAMAGAQQLLSDSSNASLIDSIARALAEESHFDEAKRLTGQISDANYRSSANYSVLTEQAKQGLVDDARSTLAQISGEQYPRLALCELAKAEYKAGDSEHALQHLARADELTKAMSVKDQYAKSSRNNSLHTVAQAHLDVNDWRGAKAIVPLLFNEKGFAYQNSLIDYVTKKLDELRAEKIKAGDLDGAEALVEQLPVAQRGASYAYLAGQTGVKENQERLSSLAKKIETLLASAKNAKEKFVIETALSDVATLRNDAAGAARWRQQAVAVCAAALKEPEVLEGETRTYYLLSRLDRLRYDAKTAGEESSLRKIVEAAHGGASTKTTARAQYISIWKNAIVSLALQTHKAADVNAVATFIHDFAKDVGASDIKDIARWLSDAGEDATGEKILNMIVVTEDRTKALNEYSLRKYAKQFDESIKKADFGTASKAIAQMPEGSDKDYKYSTLANAQAGEGDFAAAANTATAIVDGQQRLNVLGWIAYQRADAGDHAASTEVWQQKQLLLAAITEPIRRVTLEWSLYGGPPTPAMAREAMPAYFAEVLALPEPKIRVEQLRCIILAANRAGLFPMQREARAEALMTAATTKDLETWSLNNLDLNTSECLEQASGPARDSYLGTASNKFAAAGNIAAAQALAAKLTGKPAADTAQSTLASAFAERGDFAAARAAQEKITDEYARSNTTRAVVHAFVKAGNLIAAKDYAEHAWPKSDSAGDELIREMATAGEVAWASENVKRLGDIYGPGARAAVTAIQIFKGDLSTAEAAFAGCRYDSDRAHLIRTAVESGHLDLATKWMKSLTSGVNEIVAAQVRTENLEGARALAAQVELNNERVSAFRALATAQAKMGDLEGARATFRAASKKDKRTPANFNVEPFINCQLSDALAGRPDFAAAMTVANAITDPYWHDRALANIVSAAAPKNVIATETALKAINDPPLRSKSASDAVDSALKQSHPNDALAYIDLASDEGFRAICLGVVMNYGIDHGDISEVLPRVLALKDLSARAWLFTEALRSCVFLETKTGNTNLPAAARAAVAAMPADYWQGRLYADLARFAGKLDPASAQALRDKTLASAQALSGDDAIRWKRYIESAKKTAEAAGKSPTVAAKEDKVQKARENAIDEWASLLQSEYKLNAPLFTDFKATMDGLANSVPSSSENKSSQLFSNVQQQAQRLIDTLKEVHTLRTKVDGEIKTAAKTADQ